SFGAYAGGIVAALAFVAALAAAGVSLRRLLLPDWAGAPARLAEATLALALAVALAELLGLAGLLRGEQLLVAAGVAALAARWAQRRYVIRAGTTPAPPRPGRWAVIAGVVIGIALVAQWSLGTLKALDDGIWVFDSTWYHMPLAAGF